MQTLDQDQVSAYMEAAPETVYALVADVTRMPEFSPEILRCTGLDGATGPALRVYNVMQSEGRRVAAALIPAP